MEGIFTISLDFELHWGVFDKRDRKERQVCYQNTLKLVPQMLKLFSEYEVHVTWATVGSLFVKDEDEWNDAKPKNQPSYVIEKYSPYRWARENGLGKEFTWAHFAPEEVKMISDFPGQELGTHTFSHYYCLEQLNGEDAFDADLKVANHLATKLGNQISSLVFPRNQFNPYHLQLCYQNGIRTVRSNTNNWFWSPITNKASLARKVFRTGDAYFKMGKTTTYPLSSINIKQEEPLQLPASRLLRPWHPKYKVANALALRRSINELQSAAQNQEVYHLWWHPENFGDYPKENMDTLKAILEVYKKCKNKYGMTSWNMGEYADRLLN